MTPDSITAMTPLPPLNITLNQQSVLIVGGGMVGLTLALMLAQQSISVVLLESVRYPQISLDPHDNYHSSFDARNTALSRRTVQIYTDLGIWAQLASYATPIHQVQISDEQGLGKSRLNTKEEHVDSFGQVIENAWLGRVLLAAVRANPSITLYDNTRVTHIAQHASHVVVTASQDQQIMAFTSTLLIAADGRDSFCRNSVGVGAQTHDYGQVALVTTVETSKPHAHIAFERFTASGPLALLPLPHGRTHDHQTSMDSYRRSVVWTVPAGQEHAWLGDINNQKFLDALQHSFGGRVGEFVRTGARHCYPLAQVLADKQVIGRVLLMGNAAHTLHPVAGQGFNLCLRDGAALTTVLQQQLQQQADLGDHAILLAYEASRLADQQRVIRFCDSVVRGFSNHHPVLRVARNAGLFAFDMIPGVKQLVANYAMGLST